MGLAALGAYHLTTEYFNPLIKGIWRNFLQPRARNLKARYGSDSWVLITGASDGIGEQLCYEFAKEGFDIVLVSRNQDKLNRVAQFIEQTYKVKTKSIQFDFATLNSVEEAEKLE